MRPTAAFAASPCAGKFVGWTLSSPARGACRRVSTPSPQPDQGAWLGITMPNQAAKASPNLTGCSCGVAPAEAHCSVSAQKCELDNSATECVICGVTLAGRQARFCSTRCKNKHHQSYTTQKSRGLARKIQIVRSMGGKCSRCGYNTNLAAFNFHHQDASRKQFKLDMRSLSNRTWELVMAELAKCSLVCANCHAELHNPHLTLHELP